jgi:hypothetical protein
VWQVSLIVDHYPKVVTVQNDPASALITQDSWQVRNFSFMRLLEHCGGEAAERTHFLLCNYRFQRAEVKVVRTWKYMIIGKALINQRSIWFANVDLGIVVSFNVATRIINRYQLSAGHVP